MIGIEHRRKVLSWYFQGKLLALEYDHKQMQIKFLKEIQKMVKDYTIAEEIDFVLETNQVFYSDESTDITEKVIEMMNVNKDR